MRRIKPFQPVLRPFTKPNVTPYCGISLVILLLLMTFGPDPPSHYHGVTYDKEGIQHADLVTRYPPYYAIGIDKRGRVIAGGGHWFVTDLEKLPMLIEESGDDLDIVYKKIQFFIEGSVKFGRVLEVFRVLKRAGYDEIFLSTDGLVTNFDFDFSEIRME